MKENRRKYGRGFLKSKKVLETRKTRDFSTQT